MKIMKIIMYVCIACLGVISLLLLGLHTVVTSVTAIATFHFDIQILLFILISIFLLTCFVCLFFIKIKSRIKIPLLITLLLLQIGFITHSFIIPSVDKLTNIERCVDAGGNWDNINKKCLED